MTTEVVPVVRALQALRSAEVSPTQMVLPENLSFEKWELVGEAIRLFRNASKWWIGDWIIHGEATYGEKYAQAVEETGYEIGYLRNIVSCCKNVAPSRRREDLSFGHHMEVAKLKPRDQKRWLSIAAREQLSQRAIRERIRDEEATVGDDGRGGSAHLDSETGRGAGGGDEHPATAGSARDVASRALPSSVAVPVPWIRRLVDESSAGRDGYVKVPRDVFDRLRGLIE